MSPASLSLGMVASLQSLLPFAWRDHCNSGHEPQTRSHAAGRAPKADFCDRVVGFELNRKICCARRGLRSSRAELLGAMTSHGPSRRVPTSRLEIKSPAGENWRAGHGPGGVCSKGCERRFRPRRARQRYCREQCRRRHGRASRWRPRSAIGPRRRASRNANGQSRRTGARPGAEAISGEAVGDAAR